MDESNKVPPTTAPSGNPVLSPAALEAALAGAGSQPPQPPETPLAPAAPRPTQGLAAAPKAPVSNKILVDADKLQALMDRLERLEAATSKAGLARFDDQHRGEMGKEVKVRSYNGKVILGWRMIEDIVEKDAMTKTWIEKQTIELIHEDDSTVQIPYIVFVGRYQLHKASVESTTVAKGGNTILGVKLLEDGRELMLDQRFIN